MVTLPLSKDPIIGLEYDSIYVIIDRFTKYAYIVPVLGRTIFVDHGIPDEVILDRDKLFTSKF